MKSRTAIRLAIPCVCFAAAWIVTHALQPAPVTAAAVTDPKASGTPKLHAAPRAVSAQKITAALQSAPSGNWQAAWTEFAVGATEAELLAVAMGEPGMAKNLAWEELAVRRPELLVVAQKSATTPELIAAAAATQAAHDPEATLEQVLRTKPSSVHPEVLTTIAWQIPDAARRCAEILPRNSGNDVNGKSASHVSIAAAWTRRDPHGAAAAGFAHVPMWARVDAVGALSHLLSTKDHNDPEPALWMVAAALRQSPAEAVKLIEAHPALSEVCSQAPNKSRGDAWLARWYSVSPESCLAAVAAAAAKQPAMKPGMLHIIAAISPEATEAVAAHFPDFDLEDWERRDAMRQPNPALDFDPVSAADALLAALDQHPPAEAMAAAGLTPHQAAKLAELLAAQLPDTARALAAKVPRADFDADPAAFPFVAQSVMDLHWPPALTAAPGAEEGLSIHGTIAMLRSDPARYAATVDPSANNGWAACNAATCWAPHDFAAASSWVRALPAGVAKQRAEAAVAMELTVQNPLAGLVAMTALPDSVWAEFGQDVGAGAWLQALHHLALSGGDWRQWQAKTPEPLRARVQTLARDALETDATLLAVLRETK